MPRLAIISVWLAASPAIRAVFSVSIRSPSAMSPAIPAFSSAITAPSSTPMASEFSPSAGPAGTIGAASPGCSSAGAVEPIAPAPDRDRRPGPRPALRPPAAGGLPGQGPEAQATAPGHAVRGVAGWIDGRAMKTGSVCARTTSGIIDAIHVGPNDRSIDGRRCNEPARVQSQRRSRAAKPIYREDAPVGGLPARTEAGGPDRAIVMFDRDHREQVPGRRLPVPAGILHLRFVPGTALEVTGYVSGLLNRCMKLQRRIATSDRGGFDRSCPSGGDGRPAGSRAPPMRPARTTARPHRKTGGPNQRTAGLLL